MNPFDSDSDPPHWLLSDDIYSSSNTRGQYNPMHFVVRLQPDLHNLLKSGPTGYISIGAEGVDRLFAFSTYFHETIHWWQHIGSTAGLIMSFAYPAQAHVNHRHLLDILRSMGPRKPLRELHEKHHDRVPAAALRDMNIVLNNWHDVEFCRRFMLDPMHTESFAKSPYFDCIGHCYEMGIGHTLWLLGSTIDQGNHFLPDPRAWEDEFHRLRTAKVEGFYPGSSIRRAPIGAYQIFEGQARFCQLQYLHLASDGTVTWDFWRNRGMLGQTYITAFEWFLKFAGLDWPASPIHPTVSLFLLVCDLAINPCDGFPFDPFHAESFIFSNDPGIRFTWFSQHVAKLPHLKNAIQHCTREEYLDVATELSRTMACRNPVEIAEHVLGWAKNEQSLKQLLQEDDTFDFRHENLPVRVCFAKFLRFAADRARRPEFFCWPGMYSAFPKGAQVDHQALIELFERHRPLFMADLNGEIRPALVEGRQEAKIYQTFNAFYYANVVYDLVRQWTVEKGPFNYDYSWLTQKYTASHVKPWADKAFEEVFGVFPDTFQFE